MSEIALGDAQDLSRESSSLYVCHTGSLMEVQCDRVLVNGAGIEHASQKKIEKS